MKNQLIDLNDHLFAQLERLGDEELDAEQLTLEIDRAKAIAGVADRVIHNAALVLKAKQAYDSGELTSAHPLLEAK